MPLTNFPQGVSSFGIPLIGSGPILTTGSVFFVQSTAPGASDSNAGTSADKPLATIAAAVAKCTANKGDVIFVGSGHVETVVTTGGLALNVAGITVLGIRAGTLMPQISVGGATSARMTVSAANVTLANMLITGDLDAITFPVSVSGADFRLLNCEYRDVTGQCGTFLQTTAGANRMLIDGLVYRGDSAAGSARGIGITGCTDIEIRNSSIVGNFSAAAINVVTTATTNLRVHNTLIKNFNSADVCVLDTVTGSTGWIGPNLYLDLTDNAANITEAVTGATFRLFDNVYVVNADNEKAMLINWTASTDA